MRFLMTVALASAVGLGISVAAAQQDEAAEEPQQAAMEEEAASETEPRSEEETLSGHFSSFLDRVEARREADSEPDELPPETRFRYHPGW